MKKLFLFLLISIFFMSLVSAWSYDNSERYGDAYAYAKVIGMHPECEGNVHGYYCAGKWYVDVSHVGDKLYIGYGASDWLSCNQFGCHGPSGTRFISDGRRYLNDNGKVPKYILCAHDRTDAPNGDWAWASICGGYLGDYFSMYNVKCYDNNDCSSGQTCDKPGDWTTWRCKTDPCASVTCEDKCENSIRYYSGYCSNGECVYQTQTCTYGCLGKLCAEDPCKGVVCDDKCENSIWSHNGHCVNGNCIYDSEDTCQFGCQDKPFLAIITGQGMCRDDPCVGIVCDDYCSETSLFYDGKCIGGECTNYKEKQYAEECGFVPPPIPILSPIAQFFVNIWDWIKSLFGG